MVSVAKQYQNQGLSLPDLINEGEPRPDQGRREVRRDARFQTISYAAGFAVDPQALAEQSGIVPAASIIAQQDQQGSPPVFEQESNARPSPGRTGYGTGSAAREGDDALRAGRHVFGRRAFADGEDNSLLDVLVNPDSPNADRGLISESLSTEVDRALETLTERERDIIKYFFGIGCSEMTLEEIGEKFDLTRERVRQIKEKGHPPPAPLVAQQTVEILSGITSRTAVARIKDLRLQDSILQPQVFRPKRSRPILRSSP